MWGMGKEQWGLGGNEGYILEFLPFFTEQLWYVMSKELIAAWGQVKEPVQCSVAEQKMDQYS